MLTLLCENEAGMNNVLLKLTVNMHGNAKSPSEL